jgi:hypothetical protein
MDIETIVSLFDRDYSLVIYQSDEGKNVRSNVTDHAQEMKEEISTHLSYDGLSSDAVFGMEIMLSSTVTTIAEYISSKELTRSPNTAVLNATSIEEGFSILRCLISENVNNGILLYHQWIGKIMEFIQKLRDVNPKTTVDSLLVAICEKFRIDSISALRVLNFLAKSP